MKKYGDRFYFGFSSFANMRANCHKTAAVIAAVPDDRLLLESDLEDPDDVPHALNTMLHTMAEAKGWTVEQTAAITKRNAQRFATAHGASVRASPSAQPAAALAEIPGDEEWQELRRAIAEQANTVNARLHLLQAGSSLPPLWKWGDAYMPVLTRARGVQCDECCVNAMAGSPDEGSQHSAGGRAFRGRGWPRDRAAESPQESSAVMPKLSRSGDEAGYLCRSKSAERAGAKRSRARRIS